METPTASGRQSALRALLGSVVLLALAGTAAAANCASASRDLQSAAVPLDELTIRIVDLGDAGMADEPEVATGPTESMAPLLFLAPRVTSILEDVFGADEIAGEDGAEQAAAAADDTPEETLRRSPVAETDGASISRAPSLETDHASILPKYQRQMYRTDI